MRGCLLSLLFILCSCSSTITREPSSYYWRPGEVSALKSHIRLLSIKTIDQEQAYFFYFESRDQFGELIDFDPSDLSFRTPEEVPYEYFRDDLGKYYYRIYFSNLRAQDKTLTVHLRGRAISQVELRRQAHLASSDLGQSKMRVLKYANHTYHFELELMDSRGQLIEHSTKPEFLLEGEATLGAIYPLGPGKWGGEVHIMDTNSIIYLSPRLNSNHLPRLLRIQHIEK